MWVEVIQTIVELHGCGFTRFGFFTDTSRTITRYHLVDALTETDGKQPGRMYSARRGKYYCNTHCSFK